MFDPKFQPILSIEHKRGDTFVYTCRIDDVGVNLNDYTVRSQLRRKDKVIQEFACAIVSDTDCTVRAEKEDTVRWGVGEAIWDIEFTRISDGYRRSTRDVTVVILKDATYDNN